MTARGDAAAQTTAAAHRVGSTRRPAAPAPARQSGRPTVAAIIPAWNEGANIGVTVETLRRSTVHQPLDIIVVDDGSSDDTPWRAAAAGAQVLTLSRRRGKAAAVRWGVQNCRADVLLFLDADLGTSACHVPALLEPLLAGGVDMTIGCLPDSGRRGGFGWVVGSASWALRHMTGITFRQPLAGQRAVRRRVLQNLSTWGWGFGLEVALTAQALAAGFAVEEVPTNFSHRVTDFTAAGMWHRARQLGHVWLTLAVLAWQGVGR